MTNTNATPADKGLEGTVFEDKGPAGWLHTSDHKRIGRMFITMSLLFAGFALVLDFLVRLDLISDNDSPVLGFDSFAQIFVLTREALVLLVLIPLFLGLAIYLVPLQIGAANVAFPRAAAASFWGWLVSAGVLLGAYVGNGGPYGGWQNGVDLHLLALAGLVLSLLAGAVTVGTTVLTMRSPGLFLDDTPPFSWSALVTASMLTVTLPVLLGQITILYLDHRYGEVFLDGNAGIWQRVDWVYQTPQLFIYVVPVLGVVAEIMLAVARRRVFEPLALYFTIGLVGLFGFGAWANFGITTEGADIVDGAEGIVLVALYAGAAVGVATLLGLLGFTVMQSRSQARKLARQQADAQTPDTSSAPANKPSKASTAVLAALAAGQLLLLALVIGLLGAVADWLNIAGRGVDGNAPLRFTTFVTGQMSLLAYGAGLLAALAALYWWAPKIWGTKLLEPVGCLSVIAVGFGAFAAWLGPVLSGAFAEQPEFVYHDPTLTTNYQSLVDSTTASGFTALGLVGVILIFAGFALTVLNLLRSLMLRSKQAGTDQASPDQAGTGLGSDPWGALSPEWLLDSPPLPGHPETLPVLTTGMPLLPSEPSPDGEELSDAETAGATSQ